MPEPWSISRLTELARERFDERAGIREFGGGMFRLQAERHAWNDVHTELETLTDKETARAVIQALKEQLYPSQQERLNL